MTTYIDRAYLDIDGDEIECSSINISVNPNIDPVNTMNRENRAKGVTGGIPEFLITAECPVTTNDPVDFSKYARDRTTFQVTVEEEGGEVKTYFPCWFKSADKSSAQGEAVNWSLEILALDIA